MLICRQMRSTGTISAVIIILQQSCKQSFIYAMDSRYIINEL